MNKNDPVNARIRLAIAQWPDDAARGAVTTFCTEYEITRKTFYAIRARAHDEGQAAAVEPRSRRPKTSPTKLTEDLKQETLKVRAALESSGLDHGPISVHYIMVSLGVSTPSPASLARIFREKNVARAEPKKKPRAAYRRFVYPARTRAGNWMTPSTCSPVGASGWSSNCKMTIHASRSPPMWLPGKPARRALAVVKKGIGVHGVPQRLLTDHGMALNPSRHGWEGPLVTYVSSLGVEAITGKPYKPTTQGKNERFHQTLFRWLDKQPLTQSHEELQAQVDRFDLIYNTERPHQGLPGRITPQQSWDATALAEAPRPRPLPVLPEPEVVGPVTGPPSVAEPVLEAGPDTAEHTSTEPRTEASSGTNESQKISGSIAHPAATGSQKLKVYPNGVVNTGRTLCSVTKRMGGRTVAAAWDLDGVVFASTEGEIIAEYFWPSEGTAYVGMGKARAHSESRGAQERAGTYVRRQQVSPLSHGRTVIELPRHDTLTATTSSSHILRR